MNVFEGAISCKAIIESNHRQCDCLYVDRKKRSKDFSYIISLAKKKGIKVTICDREFIDDISQSTKHGGMILTAGVYNKKNLTDKIDGFLCYVDGIEDPYNLGSICRTLYASGCSALILPDRDWSMSESVIMKASAGAYERMDIYWIHTEDELISYLKKYNIPLYCASRKNAKGLYEIHFEKNFCMAIGGSFRGLSSMIESNSKQNVVIEYGREFRNALDAASAVSVISFEILRQRKNH